MRFLVSAIILFGIPAVAAASDLPYGWDHCKSVYPDKGAAACVAYVTQNCDATVNQELCLKTQMDEWRRYDINARFLKATKTSGLSAISDASSASADLLNDAVARCVNDVRCHLSHAIENALKEHLAVN